ncbi:serine hydrolase domain-containing protein [Arthrobacter humicola]|uniref:serine hydrolase domain-containing protein n=1 Tax=Arthrobacter humicola TaxID=409291 RepID=UPI001FAD5957|nr:serine hydrolase domain-containing protein [Arthrobacter humicola]MCI9870523.1 beta-lactamase family protein [Arthrobacter humicola]
MSGCVGAPPGPAPSSVFATQAATDSLERRVQAATDSLEGRVQHFMDGGATSLVVQVRWPGGEWSKAYGVRNLDSKEPARPQDRVSVASITKSMVAVSVLKLVDQGLIGLDDPVNGVLESFRTTLRPPGPITVRQLLNHNSGMPDYVDSEYTAGPLKQVANTRLSMQRGLELAAMLPWEAKNVGRFSYSNSNYLALGQLIEKLRGRPVADVLNQDIFGPLGLQHTSLAEPDRGAPDNIHAYIIDGGERVDVTQPEIFVGSPAGGVISTTQDINTFYRALLRGQLLSPAMLEEMKKKTEFWEYGLGLARFPDACSGGFRYGHAGYAFGYMSISITSADGGNQITMTMAHAPLPWQDPATARRADLLQTQMEQAAQETLDRLCGQ